MPKIGTPIMAAILAVVGFATVASADQPGFGYGSYQNNRFSAPAAFQAPCAEQTITRSALVLTTEAAPIDPCLLRYYCGPRFSNTLTWQNACTYLRP